MYPNLYYFLKDAFGVEWEGARFLNSFGFFVALAFIAGAIVLTKGLQRKEKQGFLFPKEEKRMFGQPATTTELLLNALLGFLMGYKIIGAFMNAGDGVNPQEYIFSSEGSWGAGIALAVFFAWLKWYEKNKQKAAKPEERKVRVWPHERVGDITVMAAIFGFAGAKVFHNLENWDEFVADPIGSLVSFSGLTFYGGLICAAIAIIVYAKRKGISIRHLADTMGPTLMLAYAIGRIGCQVAGDGDWGVPNAAYVTDSTATVQLAKPGEFQQAVQNNTTYIRQEFGREFKVENVPSVNFKGPSFLPVWMVAYTYPHNVNSMGVKLPGCDQPEHCNYLPLPVFPTPFYETVMCLLLFGILLFARGRIKLAGGLFCLYLVLNGLERFFIEKIRVNTKYEDLPFQPTQAELISLGLVILGIVLYFVAKRKAESSK
ncbi:prolipoprotein diacylglyceryl transferase [Lacibacter sediminis]|uniref:Prolipoprotein diacylglyceryl transferase n=1 Tax=Lacibacter sediminis TaxID=2760713 RepID=A0A7G5XBZ6_9BACT|nr:prolipoprotein diacylglyceryl transferase family protein [Lacibacter sediminis]QNA42999.1 prolipoprotein diacylglyceryl transferase [Lacibacter sediminis]